MSRASRLATGGVQLSTDLLAVGVDALDPTLLERWARDLPNLRETWTSGVGTRLESTLPAVTGVAWPTLMTGKNPAKTGVSGFESDGRIVSRNDVQSRCLWELLDDAGREVCVVGVPLSYPPDDLENGVVVAGIRTPPDADDWVSPRDLAAGLPEPIFDTGHAPKADLLDAIRRRRSFSRSLLRRRDWDVFVTVFMEADRGGHSLLSPTGSGEATGYDDLKEVYVALDEAYGELRRVSDARNVLVFSDHGFGRAPHRRVNMHRWLAERGHVDASTERPSVSRERVEGVLDRLGLVSLLPAPIKRLGRRILPSEASPPSAAGDERRAAYREESNGGGLQLPAGDPEQVEQLVAELRELTDPETGTDVFERVVDRDDVYDGPYLDQFPEILAFPSQHHQPRPTIGSSLVEPIPESSQSVVVHRYHGVLLAAGDDIETSGADWTATYELADVTPTALHLAEAPVPRDCDGRVRTDLFAPGGDAATWQVRTSTPSAERRVPDDAGDPDDQVREHLEDLGYL